MAARTRRPTPSHQSILNEIGRIREAQASGPARLLHAPLAAMLDGLNVLGALDGALAHRPRIGTWGPRSLTTLAPVISVSAVIWQRAPGYHGYRTLTLLGVWAIYTGDLATQRLPPVPGEPPSACVRVGVQRLSYQPDFYEPEAYHRLMARGFDVYYAYDGAPPLPAACAYDAPYVPGERLALRARLPALLAACS